jgi:hypothetical protein
MGSIHTKWKKEAGNSKPARISLDPRSKYSPEKLVYK